MCAPGCIEHVHHELSRRALLRAAAPAAAAAATTVLATDSAEARPISAFHRVVDLTHTHAPEFPTFFGTPGISLKQLKSFEKDGFNMTEWTVLEHSGTHIDAPIHFAKSGPGPAEIPAADLVVPLAVIDVAAKAAANPDYQLTPDDIRAWESRHGRLPRRSCVAMHSGWEAHAQSARYVGKDERGTFHFPGIHSEATAMLLKERQVVGLAVDTLSLDHGPSKDFRTHYAWLPAGRWGLENVAGLGRVPPRGATIVVGAPKIKGATGGPTRVLALMA